MNGSIFRISLDIHEHGSQAVLKAKYGDTGRTLRISLRSGGTPYIISEFCTAIFKATKPDGTILSHACTIEDNEIVYEFTPQTCAAIGRTKCEIALYGTDDDLITSPRFALLVDGVIYPDGRIESTDDFAALTVLISDTNKFIEGATKATQEANKATEDANKATEDAKVATQVTDIVRITAQEVITEAIQATKGANTATDNANEATGSANVAAATASRAATDAITAADAASEAANEANAAAQNTKLATQIANTATEAANQATVEANIATDNANGATQSANTATVNANGATNRANEATQAANDAAIAANLAAENANDTVANVTHIVKNTMTAGTVAGESVSMDDAVEFGFIGCRIFGKTTQNGTPTPDAPVELVSVGNSGSITVNVSGKNEEQHMTIATPNGLPGIPVTKGGNYIDANGQQWTCDEIDFARGVYVQRCAKLSANQLRTEGFYVEFTECARVPFNLTMKSSISPGGLSTHLPMLANYTIDTPHFYVQDSICRIFAPISALTERSADGVIAWAKELGIEFVYLLLEPIETPLSEEELAAYASLHTYRDSTTVSNDAGAHMELQYVMDSKKYIDSKLSSAIHAATVE